MPVNQYQSIIDQMTKSVEDTNARTKARETEARGIYDQIAGFYSQGGAYGQGLEASLERERTKAMSTGSQSLISSGMYNTTQLAGLSNKFSEDVAMPTRAKLEDLRMDKLSTVLGQKATMITDIQDTQPDYKVLASLLQSGALSYQQPTSGLTPNAQMGYTELGTKLSDFSTSNL